jgi:hypothetical protein
LGRSRRSADRATCDPTREPPAPSRHHVEEVDGQASHLRQVAGNWREISGDLGEIAGEWREIPGDRGEVTR